MFKRHHKILIVLTVVGIVILLYLILKHRGGGSASADASNMPTIISTGGGTISPTIPTFQPQTFDSSFASAPIAPTSGASVMPGTSGSGVPAHSAQAQEFNTGSPIATASAPASAPSFYTSAQDLHYNTLDPTYVQATSQGFKTPTSVADLSSYLGLTLRAFEVDANQSFADAPGHGAVTPSSWTPARSTSEVSELLSSQANSYCDQHPEACGANRTQVVSDLTGQYAQFTSDAAAKYSGTPTTTAPTASTPASTLDNTQSFSPSTGVNRVRKQVIQ